MIRALLGTVAMVGICFAALGAPAEHVVLISIDGLRPEFYLDSSWPAPTIQHMASEGVRAERVRSVFPSVTYPSHTAMVTGHLPARHGILFNEPFEPAGQTGRWYWEESAVRVPTLWDAVRAAGKKSACVSWPVTVGAPIDYRLAEVWSLDLEGDRLAPMKADAAPPGFWDEIEREATGRLDRRIYSADYMSRDLKNGEAAAYILETKKPALLAVHLIATDHFQHEVGRDGVEVRTALATVDSAINSIVEAATRAEMIDQTAFIVTGDHGFVDVHTQIAPNVWLAEAGLMEPEVDQENWKARFHTSGGAAFLRVQGNGERATADRVRNLLNDLPPRVRCMFRVVEQDEIRESGADPHSPLALAAGLGLSFSARATGEAVSAGSGGTHGYFPTDFPEIYTGFIGWGAGFRDDITIHDMALIDVAPTIARLLGLTLEGVEGLAPFGALME